VDIEEFYDADPRRRSSEEFEFGRDWHDEKGVRCEVSWVVETGELYVMREPEEPIITDPVGDEFVPELPTKLLTVEVLGILTLREKVDTALDGWQAKMPEANSIAWVREQVAAAQG
jgi:hypothetical protein